MPFKKINIRNSLRRFGQRRKNDSENCSPPDANGRRDSINPPEENYFAIYVHMLNDEICKFEIENNATGHHCMAKVAESLELEEHEFRTYSFVMMITVMDAQMITDRLGEKCIQLFDLDLYYKSLYMIYAIINRKKGNRRSWINTFVHDRTTAKVDVVFLTWFDHGVVVISVADIIRELFNNNVRKVPIGRTHHDDTITTLCMKKNKYFSVQAIAISTY
ncbi:hypothetical protein TrispH2_004977 [Trichoplax sp. H2]|nr:hypothetical protein TrispH2_004977 [Trichoplax sp. H2]|eukprot:RDD42618.1 hypothetical protein TrispH2_004977 [Trichoplax sp. H2]